MAGSAGARSYERPSGGGADVGPAGRCAPIELFGCYLPSPKGLCIATIFIRRYIYFTRYLVNLILILTVRHSGSSVSIYIAAP